MADPTTEEMAQSIAMRELDRRAYVNCLTKEFALALCQSGVCADGLHHNLMREARELAEAYIEECKRG